MGQLGTFTFPALLRVVLFSLFVFTIGYRSGPEFFASLSVRTLAQVAVALMIGGTGLAHRARFRPRIRPRSRHRVRSRSRRPDGIPR